MWKTFLDLIQIIFVDVSLAADNAIVVAMAANALPLKQRKLAISIGILIAMVMRIMATFGATKLLQYDVIMFIGGLSLFYMAWRMWDELQS